MVPRLLNAQGIRGEILIPQQTVGFCHLFDQIILPLVKFPVDVVIQDTLKQEKEKNTAKEEYDQVDAEQVQVGDVEQFHEPENLYPAPYTVRT